MFDFREGQQKQQRSSSVVEMVQYTIHVEVYGGCWFFRGSLNRREAKKVPAPPFVCFGAGRTELCDFVY